MNATISVGEYEDNSALGKKCPRILEAFQDALEKAPPLRAGTDVQSYRLVSVEVEFGGFTGATKTRVCVEVLNGPLPKP
jgi:hypothetical protein